MVKAIQVPRHQYKNKIINMDKIKTPLQSLREIIKSSPKLSSPEDTLKFVLDKIDEHIPVERKEFIRIYLNRFMEDHNLSLQRADHLSKLAFSERFQPNREISIRIKDIVIDVISMSHSYNSVTKRGDEIICECRVGNSIYGLPIVIGDCSKKSAIGFLKDLDDETISRYVEGFFKHDDSVTFDCWRDYCDSTPITYSKHTAKESLLSLMGHCGVDFDENILLIKRDSNTI